MRNTRFVKGNVPGRKKMPQMQRNFIIGLIVLLILFMGSATTASAQNFVTERAAILDLWARFMQAYNDRNFAQMEKLWTGKTGGNGQDFLFLNIADNEQIVATGATVVQNFLKILTQGTTRNDRWTGSNMTEVFIRDTAGKLQSSAHGPNALRKGETWVYFEKEGNEWKINKVETIETRNLAKHVKIQIHEREWGEGFGYFDDEEFLVPEGMPTFPWDVNADGIVDVFDLVIVGSEFGKPAPDLRADVNGNGAVDIFDLVTVASHFGEKTIVEDVLPPTITGSSVRDGDKDIDPNRLNADGIEITFSENVTGTVLLSFEDGRDLGWTSRFEGNKAILILERGNGEGLSFETIYIIEGTVKDAAGNETQFRIIFVTKGLE